MATDRSKSVRVTIYGNEFPIKAAADPAYVIEIARYVDGQMRSVATGPGSSSWSKMAVLAALNIADELYRERAEKETILSELAKRTQELVQRLDRGLGRGRPHPPGMAMAGAGEPQGTM